MLRPILNLLSAAILLPLAACAPAGPRPAVSLATAEAAPAAPDWRNVASDVDIARLTAMDEAWTKALGGVKDRAAARVADEGALLKPGAALDHPELSPGSYVCRAIKIGAHSGRRGSGYRAYRPFFCYIRGEADGLTFTKQTGSERPAGWLYRDGEQRYVFLGTFATGEETPPPYSVGGKHNAVGVVERVASFRWRMVLLPTASEPLTVYEIIPLAPAMGIPDQPAG